MKIHQLRNATIIVEFGDNRVLVDPMLARRASLPPLRFFGARGRNPLVDLPDSAKAAMRSVTHCLITHCQKGHFDHLDRKGVRFLRERNIPVICTPHDGDFLRQRGLNAQPLPEDHEQGVPLLGGTVRTVHCTHGRGLVGRLMEHGVGYLLEIPGEPSLYLSGDTILTPTIREFAMRHQPEVSVIPAGGARFDVGHEIIMGIDDVLDFTGLVGGTVIANHMEALSHCPVTRSALSVAAAKAGLMSRLRIPADGDVVAIGEARPGAVERLRA
ncbi:MBL fold metallo-hydrolase [Ectothiorhodospiraceae bacterium WFHF3C12]|nr:MBL fold metallo-hydrolase [Ectothiorhodospiraceae bacterium WFHF3C12]